MKVLITGANGMVARALAAHCQERGDEVLAFTREHMDIANAITVEDIFARNQPHALINCAAYTDVDGSESNKEACYAANSEGVKNLAEACYKFNTAFVTISTDYVFDGENPGFYTESGWPNPISVYGKAKYEGELRARDANPLSMIVRSGWIYGAEGTNFLSKMHLFLGKGSPIKAISDSYGTPTYAVDLAIRLRELAGIERPGVYHVTNSGEGTSYAGFAKTVAESIGADPALVEEISSSALQRPAPRPQSSKLGTEMLDELDLPMLRDWKEALGEFLRSQK